MTKTYKYTRIEATATLPAPVQDEDATLFCRVLRENLPYDWELLDCGKDYTGENRVMFTLRCSKCPGTTPEEAVQIAYSTLAPGVEARYCYRMLRCVETLKLDC